jgi:hypothetical protein
MVWKYRVFDTHRAWNIKPSLIWQVVKVHSLLERFFFKMSSILLLFKNWIEYYPINVISFTCVSLAFGCEPRRRLRIIQHFGKHCSCHLQGECVVVERFWKPNIGQVLCASFIRARPDDGGIRYLWNVGKRLPDCTAKRPRRQSSSCLPPWGPEVYLALFVLLIWSGLSLKQQKTLEHTGSFVSTCKYI